MNCSMVVRCFKQKSELSTHWNGIKSKRISCFFVRNPISSFVTHLCFAILVSTVKGRKGWQPVNVEHMDG